MGAKVWRFVRWWFVRHSWEVLIIMAPGLIVAGVVGAIGSLLEWDGLLSFLEFPGFVAFGLIIIVGEAFFKREDKPWDRPEAEWVRLRDEYYGRDTWPHRRSRQRRIPK
ncbi:MAG: hypothetical protein JWR83_791 [Aeromicrobium sp.]|nr:hypothetical protein [Aeromicrobium sp.]